MCTIFHPGALERSDHNLLSHACMHYSYEYIYVVSQHITRKMALYCIVFSGANAMQSIFNQWTGQNGDS